MQPLVMCMFYISFKLDDLIVNHLYMKNDTYAREI